MDHKSRHQDLRTDRDLCRTCSALIDDALTGDFSRKWNVWQKKKTQQYSLKHRDRDYFKNLKRPCCPLCEVIMHGLWNKHNPCALKSDQCWDLWVCIQKLENQETLPLDELTLCCHPGVADLEDTAGSSDPNGWLLQSCLLQLIQTERDGTTTQDLHILPDVPCGLPFKEMRGWINACMDRTHGHEGCRRLDPILPTRIVDIEAIPPKIVITKGLQERYIALSHCWGGPIKTRLLMKNMSELINRGISEETMPPTFRDSIFLTRKLGFRYLWIDALCIIQDDNDDWAKEAARMCDVYERASLVLEAYSTSSSETGLGFRRSTRVASNREGDIYAQRFGISDADTDKPLGSRGWTLQEHTLAFSTLSIGRGLSMYTCPGGFYLEGNCGHLQPKKNITSTNLALLDQKAKRGSSSSIAHQEDAWRYLVEDYTSRELTYAEDKLAAIAGVAAKFESGLSNFRKLSTDNRYVVGLWTESLLEDLMWASTTEHILVPRVDRAPSWSWAGWDGVVDWRFQRLIQDCAHSKGYCEIEMSALKISDEQKTAKQVSGSLVVSGLLVPIHDSLRRPIFTASKSFTKYKLLPENLAPALGGRHREMQGIIDRDSNGLCWALRLCGGVPWWGGAGVFTAFLILEQAYDERGDALSDVFRRIGIAVIFYNLASDEYEEDKWPYLVEDCIGWAGENRRVTII